MDAKYGSIQGHWELIGKPLENPIIRICRRLASFIHRGNQHPSTWMSLPPAVICVVFLGGCSREAENELPPSSSPFASPVESKPEDVLVFSREHHVDDPTVNAFVARSMRECAGGDYEQFRFLWSAREEVLPREEFDQGWQAVREIRVRKLGKVMLAADEKEGRPEPETVYALLAEVTLDQEHPAARDEPTREVALMLVREQDEWRLAKAPRTMREWLRERSGPTEPPGAGSIETAKTSAP